MPLPARFGSITRKGGAVARGIIPPLKELALCAATASGPAGGVMTSVAVAGYMTLEQAADAIDSRSMPRDWLGQEIILLETDKHVSEELEAAAAEPPAVDTPLGRLNRAINHLLRALSDGDAKAVVVDEHGHTRDFPAALWGRPGIRALFRPGELPDEFRVAVEGHKIDVSKRWVLVSKQDIHRILSELASGPEVTDVEGEFRAWLAAKLERRAQGNPVSKHETWSQAQRAFASRMRFHAFERIWTEMVPHDWSRPERPGR
jgi:hypothetical protein